MLQNTRLYWFEIFVCMSAIITLKRIAQIWFLFSYLKGELPHSFTACLQPCNKTMRNNYFKGLNYAFLNTNFKTYTKKTHTFFSSKKKWWPWGSNVPCMDFNVPSTGSGTAKMSVFQ